MNGSLPPSPHRPLPDSRPVHCALSPLPLSELNPKRGPLIPLPLSELNPQRGPLSTLSADLQAACSRSANREREEEERGVGCCSWGCGGS